MKIHKEIGNGKSLIGLTHTLSLNKNRIWINFATRMSTMNKHLRLYSL